MVSRPGMLILVGMMSVTAAAQGIRPQDVALQRAIRMETVDRDSQGALRLYGELAAQYATTDPGVAAQSLARMGALYQTIGDAEKARSTFERILRDYPNQSQAAAQARRALDASGRRITQERLSPGVGDKGADDVSPDGRWIVFASREGFTIRRNGSTQDHVSVAKADTPFFSPDSKRVVYNNWAATPSEFRLANLDGTWSPRNVRTSPPDVRYYNPGGWSADGQSILVEIVHQDWTKEIAWLSLATGETRVLINVGRRRPQDPGERISLSPDGKRIVYSAFPVDPGENANRQLPERNRHLYLLPSQGGTPIELVGGSINVRPVWTPDSRRVVFVSNRSGSFGVWSSEATNETGERRQSPIVEMASSGRIAALGITRNGDFYFRRGEAGVDLFSVDIRPDGRAGTPAPLPTGETGVNFTPAWSPDRRFIAYKRQRQDRPSGTYSLVVHSMSDHTERVFASRDLASGTPVWLADGKRLLVMEAGSPGPGVVLNVDDGTFAPARDVLGFAASRVHSIALAPEGTTAYVGQPNADGTYVIAAVDRTTGTRRVVTTLGAEAGISRREINGTIVMSGMRSDLVLSPDGRTLAFITAPSGTNTGTVRVVGVDGQGLRELSSSASNRVLAWSPDSSGVYFLEARGGTSRLLKAPANGGAAQDAGLALPYDKQRWATLAGAQLVFAQEAAVSELWVVKNFAAK